MTALALLGQTLLLYSVCYVSATPGQWVFKKLTIVCNIPKLI